MAATKKSLELKKAREEAEKSLTDRADGTDRTEAAPAEASPAAPPPPGAHTPVAYFSDLKRADWPKGPGVEAFYGVVEIGVEGIPTERWEARATQRIHLPIPLRMRCRPGYTIRKLRASRRVIPSLNRIFAAIALEYSGEEGLARLREAEGDLFAGCYIPLAGDAALHPHAWGAAIRLGGAKGAPAEIAAIFEAEGWSRLTPTMFAAVAGEE